jgi:hypothetical protein
MTRGAGKIDYLRDSGSLESAHNDLPTSFHCRQQLVWRLAFADKDVDASGQRRATCLWSPAQSDHQQPRPRRLKSCQRGSPTSTRQLPIKEYQVWLLPGNQFKRLFGVIRFAYHSYVRLLPQ